MKKWAAPFLVFCGWAIQAIIGIIPEETKNNLFKLLFSFFDKKIQTPNNSFIYSEKELFIGAAVLTIFFIFYTIFLKINQKDKYKNKNIVILNAHVTMRKINETEYTSTQKIKIKALSDGVDNYKEITHTSSGFYVSYVMKYDGLTIEGNQIDNPHDHYTNVRYYFTKPLKKNEILEFEIHKLIADPEKKMKTFYAREICDRHEALKVSVQLITPPKYVTKMSKNQRILDKTEDYTRIKNEQNHLQFDYEIKTPKLGQYFCIYWEE